MYNLIIKYSMYKKGRRGLRPDSLAWHKARGGVGERPFARTWPDGCGLWQKMLTCRMAVGGRFVEKSINLNELYCLY